MKGILPLKPNLILCFLFMGVVFELHAQTWNLVWSDEFSGSSINGNNWNFETGGGGWGNNELENYTNRPENAVVKNDKLLIIGRKESYNGSIYTSARMNTKGLQEFTYGKMEASIKIPTGKGTWPAFWMLGKNISQVGWPSCGEIDIMEHVNSDNILYGTIHWNNNGHAQYGGNTTFNTSQYHIFGIEWDTNAIRWYLDGTKYHDANIANNVNNTGAFHEPFFFILNLAIGGTWPGNPDATTAFPDTMYVDYVRVYQQVIANAPPASITSSGNTTFCTGDSLVLNANSGTGYTYQWNKGGTAMNGETGIKFAAKTSGSYTVTVSANGLSTTSAATSVTVNSIPSPPTVTSTVYYCQGATPGALSASGTTLKWYTLSNGGTSNTTAFTPGTSAAGTTNYYVSQTINNCESPRAKIAVTVNPLPAANITPAGSTSFCSGGSVVLNANSGTGLSYQWNNNGSAIGAAIATSYSTGTEGSYTVTVKNTNNCSATSTAITVSVSLPPSTAIAGSDQYITVSSSQLSANIPSSGTGAWSVTGGTAVFTNPNSGISSVSGLSNGANILTWTISNGNCPSTSSSVTIHVGTPPITQTITGSSHVNPNAAGEIYFVGSNPSSTYHWTVPNGATITSANTDSSQITVTFGTDGGNVSVSETNPYGNTTDLLPVTINSTTGLSFSAISDFCKIYPNPFSDYSSLSVHCRKDEEVHITIIDVQGNLVFSSSNFINNQEIVIGNGFPKGIYFVRLIRGPETKIIKLIKI